jgi:hypothetical protein
VPVQDPAINGYYLALRMYFLGRVLRHRDASFWSIVLYAVSALFALLSLFLLWPTGSSLGLVLAVLGTGHLAWGATPGLSGVR